MTSTIRGANRSSIRVSSAFFRPPPALPTLSVLPLLNRGLPFLFIVRGQSWHQSFSPRLPNFRETLAFHIARVLRTVLCCNTGRRRPWGRQRNPSHYALPK